MTGLDHPRFHSPDSFILRIVRNVRRTVKEIIHAVASERLHNGTSVGSGDRFTWQSRVRKTHPSTKTDHSHLFTDISDQCSGLADADGSVQGLSGDTHQLLRVFINVAHRIGFVQVRMQTLGIMLSARQAGNLRPSSPSL